MEIMRKLSRQADNFDFPLSRDGSRRLAKAVIKSAIRDKDEVFLMSNNFKWWEQFLYEEPAPQSVSLNVLNIK